MYKVAVFVGSLRRESINLKLAKAWIKLAAPRLEGSLVDIHGVPILNEDLFQPTFPEPALRIKRAIADADGVLLVSPEYNRSVTPAMKNVIDWGSRPLSENSWKHKPCALMGASLGAIGTAVGTAALRTPLIVLDALLMGQPEIYLSYRDGQFDAEHDVADEGLRALLVRHIDAFEAWLGRFAQAR